MFNQNNKQNSYSTFWFNQELPQLPVPDLWLTVSRYLASLKSILAPDSSDKLNAVERGLSMDDLIAKRGQFEQTSKLVHQFMLYEGPQLQRDLKEYASKHQNWVSFVTKRTILVRSFTSYHQSNTKVYYMELTSQLMEFIFIKFCIGFVNS